MFNATLADTRLLKDSIDTISQIIDEGLFKINSNGMELLAADRAMVTVVDFKLSSKAFEKYSCETDQSVGLNLISLLTILKRAGTSDKLLFSVEENKFNISMVNEMGSKRNFSLPIIDIRADDVPSVSQFEFPASARVDSAMFREGINDADIVADSVLLEFNDKGLRMFAKGDTNHAELVLIKGVLLKEMQGEGVKSRFPLDYLKKSIKASKLFGNAKIYLGNDYPMKMEFVDSNVLLSFVIAPRVAEE